MKLADASLRARVMATAAILVALTSLVTGLLGTALLRSYLYSRADAQLRVFATVASRVLERSNPAVRQNGQQPALPTQFLVEVVSAGGQVQRAETPLDGADGLRLSAAQFRDEGSPFTVTAGGHSWRVLVKPLSGGRHAVVAFSLDTLDSTVTRLEIADALAGVIAIAVLAGIGLPLVRASLAPLSRIEATAEAIAGGDLSRRIDHPSGGTEVGRLADALDIMLGRIEAAYRARAEGESRALRSEDRMRQFVADASHELRTPLTSVLGLAEFGLQTFNLIPTLSAQENVEAALVPLDVAAGPRRERAAQALAEVGLADRARHLPSELSGGQQQRVAIARALVKKPGVLLADEPTGNLDEHTRDEIMTLLEDLWRERGLTLVTVTHDSSVARRAQRTAIMRNGLLTVRDPSPPGTSRHNRHESAGTRRENGVVAMPDR